MEPPLREDEVPLLEVDAITSTLPGRPAQLEEIQLCTDQDDVLAHLKDVVHHGWPEYPNEFPQDVREFWNFREDMSVENGLSRFRPQMLQIIHQGHMGLSQVTENGPQYSSREFAAFCKNWGINHITSSTLYPKSNGFIERMVKNLLKKADAAGKDPYLALLSYRATPIDSNLPSTAKVLNQRDYRTQLPCSKQLQRSQTMECNQEQLQHRQGVQKQHCDRKSPRELQKLVPDQDVFQPQRCNRVQLKLSG